MNKILLTFLVLSLVGCISNQKILDGAPAGSDAIIVGRITALPNNAISPLFTVEQRPLIGPEAGIEAQKNNPLIVQTIMPGTYNWVDIQTEYGHRNISGTLPSFNAKSGCITYIGDITINLGQLTYTGGQPSLSHQENKEATLSELKSRYPKIFSANSICPQ